MTVPLSLAVARRVPVLLSCTQASEVLCAWTIFVTLNERASNSITSPADCVELATGAADGTELPNDVEGEGSGEG